MAQQADRQWLNSGIWSCIALGFLGYLAFPWYAIQDTNGLLSIPQVFSNEQAGNGLMQAAEYQRPWLWVGLVALAFAALGASMLPTKKQGTVLLAAGALGVVGLMLSGFAIGAKGWSFEALSNAFGALGKGQFGIGWGGFVALASLVVVMAFGVARRGYFKGDLFVSAAVVGCGTMLALFILFPVLKALSGAFYLEDGTWSPLALWNRVATARNFGFGCLADGQSCGVAWNTLFLGLMTATSTVLLGTMMALMSERASKRFTKPLNILAMLPIITPPFVVGLGLILLFGRAGVVNQFLEYAFGIEPSRWFYGWFGVWVAQTFAFTPIAFMIMRGVVQG
nr:iron ABC transporter permease [Polaromonas sp.]